MGFLGLFKPKWQHKDSAVREAAVKRIDSQATLLEVLEETSDNVVFGFAMKRLKDRSAVFEKLNKARPGDAEEKLYEAAVSLADAERFVDALALFDMVVELCPRKELGWLNRGVVLNALGNKSDSIDRFRQAIDCYDKALALNESDDTLCKKARNLSNIIGLIPVDTADDRAQISSASSELAECFEKALKLNPKNPEACVGKATALLMAEEPEGALDYFERAIKYGHPNSDRIKMMLEQLK